MFPTKEEKARARELEDNYKLFEGKFGEVLNYFRNSDDRKNKKEVIVNVCEVISNTFADLLFLEEPTIKVEESIQGEVDEIIENSQFNEQLWQSAIAQSWGGKACFEVRLVDGKSVIEEIAPDYVFPQYNQRNIKAPPESIILAWRVDIDGEQYLFKKIHEVGLITYELWKCDSKYGEPKMMVPLSLFDGSLPESEQTGWDIIPIFIANNPKDGKKTDGVSDYRSLYSLLEELTRVNSQIATQLEKHADAKLAVPPGVLDEKGQVAHQKMEMIEVDASDGGMMIPEYITNSNPLIDAAFQQKKEVMEDIARISQVAFILLDLESKGGVKKDETFAESAARTIAKVKRKRKSYTRLIREVVSFAYKIQSGKDLKKTEIFVKLHDGLPENDLRKTNIEVLRIGAGIQSKRGAVSNLDGINGDVLDAKLEEIEKDESNFVNAGL